MHFARSIVLGYHFIPKIKWRSFRGRREEKWGSFRGRYHFGDDLGIISGLGIVPGSGSFRGLYISHKEHENLISKLFGNSTRLRLCTWVGLHLFERYNIKLPLSYSYGNEKWGECIRCSSALVGFDIWNGLRAIEERASLVIAGSIIYISK